MNDPFDHATGVEKWELIKKKEGNDVSFKFNVKKSQHVPRSVNPTTNFELTNPNFQ